MYRVINEYLGKVNLVDNEEIYSKILNNTNNIENVKSCTVSVNFKRYIVDIRLNKFSVDGATEVYKEFEKLISYSYSSMHVRFNEGKCIRYRYITCKENKDGFYCDIVIS